LINVLELFQDLNITVCRYPLISRQKPPADYGGKSGKYSYQEENGYFFMTHSNNRDKKTQLERIAKELGVNINKYGYYSFTLIFMIRTWNF
jgi:hypothetical protein